MTKILSNKSNIDLDYPICRPSLDLDFTQERLDPRITFTRGSIGTRVNRNRQIETIAINQPRFDYDPINGECKGLLIEESRTNSIRNNTMVGAVSGKPGTLPTNWVVNINGSGVTREIVGTGTENGITYIDIRLAGTAKANIAITIASEPNNFVVAANGQSWTYSAYVKLAAGSFSGFNAPQIIVEEYSAGGAYLTGQTTSVSPPPLSLTRIVATRTNVNASTAFEYAGLRYYINSGNTVDMTVRVGLPQLEQGAFVTSAIPTTGATTTRSADNASMTGTNFSSWYNSREGTIQTNIAIPYRAVGGARSFALDNGTVAYMLDFTNSTTVVGLECLENSGYRSIAFISNSTSIKLNQTTTYSTQPAPSQIICVNGTLNSTGKTYLTTSNYANLRLGAQVNGAAYLNGTISRFTYYPRALKPNHLQFLTT
jgi:hypothetical protein